MFHSLLSEFLEAGIMMTSKIDLVNLERNVNAENYGDVSHGHLMPFIIETFGGLLQDDNALPRRASSVH